MENQEEQKIVQENEEKETNQSLFLKPIALIITTIIVVGGWAWYLHSKAPKVNEEENENIENNSEEQTMSADFSLVAYNGNMITLDDMKETNVVLTFWSTQCSWCLKQMPELYELAKSNQNIQFLAIAAGAVKEDLAEFEKDKPVNVTLLLDTNYDVIQKYGVSGTPAHFLVDVAGRLVKEIKGYKNVADFQTILNDSF